MVPSRSTDLCHSFSAHNLPDFLCTTLPRKSTSFVFENESIPEGITIEQFVAVLLVLVYLLVVVARFFSGRKKPYVKTQENIPYIPQQDTINEHSLKLIVKVQARIRAYLARKQYMHRIYKEMAVDQIFRFDISIRRLIYGNHEKFFSIYKQYIVFPAQAIDRAGTLKLAQDFSIVPNVCNRRELNDAVDRVTNKNKNFSPGGPVLLSFQNFLELFILLSLRHVHSSSKDEAVYKFDTLLKIIESSGGHAKVSKQRSTTLVKGSLCWSLVSFQVLMWFGTLTCGFFNQKNPSEQALQARQRKYQGSLPKRKLRVARQMMKVGKLSSPENYPRNLKILMSF